MADTTKLNVNGRSVEVAGEPSRSLLEVLREDLQLTGTKYGCGEGACGACTVLIDGKRAFSCSTAVSEVIGKPIVTIEGLVKGETLHPVQAAFAAEGAMQCGYCTSGMIMAAIALLGRNPHPNKTETIDGMNPNLCRCCSYAKIIDAVKRAATTMAAGGNHAKEAAAGGKS